MLAGTLGRQVRMQLRTPRSVTKLPLCLRMSSSTFHHAPTVEEEDSRFAADVSAVQKWWDSDRYNGVKRTYSAEDVVKKRGTLAQDYPSSRQAKKLFSLLSERSSKGQPVHTSTLHLIDPLLQRLHS
jgi:hypothetical protein